MTTSSNRGLWLACFLLLGGLVAVVSAILDYASSRNVVEAIFVGGGAFAGTITLAILVIRFYQQASTS